MSKVRLSKVLGMKNRLVGKIAKIEREIQLYNSVLLEKSKRVDVLVLEDKWIRLKGAIAEVKKAIMLSNQPIYEHLVALAEAKSSIAFLSRIPSDEGEETHPQHATKIVRVAWINKKRLDDNVAKLESYVVTIQDEIDTHNANTFVELADSTVELAN